MEEVNQVIFTKHALEKFAVLKRHGVEISERRVIDTLFKSLREEDRKDGTFIASSNLDKEHILRVVYKKLKKGFKIITFYPARRKQYGF